MPDSRHIATNTNSSLCWLVTSTSAGKMHRPRCKAMLTGHLIGTR